MIRKTLSFIGVLLAGLTVAAILYVGYKEAGNTIYLSTTLDNVFEVQKVIVPDFVIGTDPNVVYERTISRDFIGDFVVEMKSPINNETVCFGTGAGFKYTEDEDHKIPITLSWFFNVHDITMACTDMVPGQYYLETQYTIKIEGLPERHLTNISNLFDVMPVEPKFSISQ